MGGRAVEIRVPARVGLLGNPSDGFGGRVIATTVDAFAARVTAEPADAWSLRSPAGSLVAADDVAGVRRSLSGDVPGDGIELLVAAVVRAADDGPEPPPARLTFESSIPRQVGLAGSSAIVIGAIRALSRLGGLALCDVDVARLALSAEADVLGWAAGPQDRVVQALGGALDMRFDRAWDPRRYERLVAAALPPMLIAWDPRPGDHSGRVHAPVRDRWAAGDAEVVAAMGRFAAIAAEGRAALDEGRAASVWPALASEAWELRTRFWPISDRDRAMVDVVVETGGGASLAGSGGAIVAFFSEPSLLRAGAAALERTGARVLVPDRGPVAAEEGS